MIQIDFYSDDMVSLLTPVYSTRPEKVYFLIDERKNTKKRIAPIKATILSWGFVREVHFIAVNRHDVEDISGKLEKLIQTIDSQIYIDLTGGSELLVACGYQHCKADRIIPIYMNWDKNYIFAVDTKKEICKISHISLDDNKISIPKKIKHKDKGTFSSDFLVKNFIKKGFLIEESPQHYRFTNATAKEYLRTFGIWLELYIYIKSQRFFDGSYLGVVLDWQRDDVFDTQDNEIDVLVMYRSVPVLISCKMREIKPNDVYEVGYLARRLGGKQTRSMIATTYPVSETKQSKTGIYQRMEKMKVGLIESADFRKMSIEAVFQKAFRMTE